MSSLSDKVLPIIRATRQISYPLWGKAEVVAVKSRDASDIVTQADRQIEQYLASELKKIDSAEFVGEEYGGDRSVSRYWLCDPIDGTALFVRGLPFCTTMLALIEDGKVNFGAIYDFVRDEMYFATRGEGAFKDSEKIRVSERSIEAAFLGWETHLDKPENNDTVLRLRKKAGLVKYMCAGFEHALVASGKLEGRLCFDPWGYDWDYAPGTLLIEEAGGIVANLGKRTYDLQDKNFIAANPRVYAALTEGPDAIFPVS